MLSSVRTSVAQAFSSIKTFGVHVYGSAAKFVGPKANAVTTRTQAIWHAIAPHFARTARFCVAHKFAIAGCVVASAAIGIAAYILFAPKKAQQTTTNASTTTTTTITTTEV